VLGVASRATLLAEVIDAVAARTDGVPLFVEELTKAVLEVGAAEAALEIPATLVDSLMARLDRLGPEAKEVAQVGAVCGREFSFELLHAVHPMAEAALEGALARLADADLLYVRGLTPQATYTFKHALVQDAAYESLLKSRRRTLHAQVAEALAQHFPVEAEAHPELLAHHYTVAGQVEPALAGWQRAGERAVARGAHREAAHYLERGLAFLDSLPDGSQRAWHEFQLQLSLGQTRLFTHGVWAPAVTEAFARAMQVGERLAEPEQMVPLLFGLFVNALSRNGPAVARPLAEQLFAVATRSGKASFLAVAHVALGLADYHLGKMTAARQHAAAAVGLWDDREALLLPVDLGFIARVHLADATWQLGFPDQSRTYMQEALARVARAPRAAERSWAAIYAMLHTVLRREAAQVAVCAQQLRDAVAEEPNQNAATIKALEGWALADGGDVPGGQALIRAGIAELLATRHRLGLEWFHCLLAETCVLIGDLDGAVRALDDGQDICPDQVSDRPTLLHLRAEIATRYGASAAEIEAAFAAALDAAQRYEARSLELRAATSYARWLGGQGRGIEAHELLAPLYATFTEGFDTRDLLEARELLQGLEGGEGRGACHPLPAQCLSGGEP